MNNLKRVLSLALASVMVLGMMVVSASAFEDDDVIANENKTAATVMNALEIIKGRKNDDGSFNFDPKAPVKRSEMAKMITVALTGDPDYNIGLASNGTFSDVPENHWAIEYIEYCASLGIIAGRGDGTFDPDANVTGQEAAKMMLVALGYKADIFGFASGAQWATVVDGLAEKLPLVAEYENGELKIDSTISLYKDVAGKRTQAMTREDAAQLIYNGLQAHTVTSAITGVQNGAPTYKFNMADEPLLVKTFKADVSDPIKLTSIAYDAKTGVYKYNNSDALKSAVDVSAYFQQEIKTVTNEDGDILAIMGASGVVGSNYIGGAKFDAKKLTIDGKELATTPEGEGEEATTTVTTEVYAYNKATMGKITYTPAEGDTAAKLEWPTGEDVDLEAWYNYDLIAEGGKVTAIVVYPTSVAQVTEVKDGKINNTYTVEAEKPENVNATTKDELAEGDYMLVSVRNGGLPTKLEKLSVLADQTATAEENGTYTIGGKEYTLKDGVTVVLGKTYGLVLVNGYVLAADNGEPPVDNTIDLSKVLYAVKAGAKTVAETTTNELGDEKTGKPVHKVNVLFTDGTSDTIDVANLGTWTAEDTIPEGSEAGDPKPVADADGEGNDGNLVEADTLYSFTKNQNGTYNLVKLADDEKLGFDNVTTASDVTSIAVGGKSGQYRITDGATLFVKYKKGTTVTVEVMTGADVKAWKGTADVVSKLYSKKDTQGTGLNNVGFGTIAVGTVANATTLPGETPVVNYGYLVSGAINVWNAEANKQQKQVKVWNGADTVTYYTESTFDFKAGTVITFKVSGNVISDVDYVTGAALKAVSAYDGSEIYFDAESKAYSMEGVKVFFIEGDKAATGTIKLAATGKKNAVAVITGSGESEKLAALFVDVKGDASKAIIEGPTDPCAEGHTAGEWVNTDSTNHWKTCSVCSTKIDSTVEAHQEASDLTWTVSGENHVKTCKCGKVIDTHANGAITDGTCTEGDCEEDTSNN